MCGIAGAAGKDSEEPVRRMLDVIKHRGTDSFSTYSTGDVTLGSVTGKKNQTVHNRSALIYDGEIYNFQDSEALFNLISSKGVEAAVKEIDGDYAFAYAENGKLHLARDTIGVKPLYYSSNSSLFAFASEKKALSAVGMNDIHTLKPGYMLSYSSGKAVENKVTCFTKGERITDESTASEMLYRAIERAVKKRSCVPIALAFSGGLDSSLIAALSCEVELYSAAIGGAHDIQQTKKAARLLNLEEKLHLHELTIDEIESAVPEVVKAVESADPVKVSIAMPLFFASKDACSDGIHVMLSGQGADELFAGYKRYELMNSNELEPALRCDLDNIAESNLERDDAVTMANAVELRMPYLDKEVVELALRIVPELKIHNGLRKYVLRLAAGKILPDELVWKEKKAAQYSSGIYSALEKLAKKNGYSGKRFLGRYLEVMTDHGRFPSPLNSC